MNTNKSDSSNELKIDIKPFGPSQETIIKKSELVVKDKLVKNYLDGTRNRLLWFEFIDPDDEYSKIVMKILLLITFVLHFMTIQIIELFLLKEF